MNCEFINRKKSKFTLEDRKFQANPRIEGMKIAAVEGAPFSGKTTLIKGLSEQFGVKFVPEYAKYASSGKDFPPFPSASIKDAKKSVEFFVDLEKKRCSDVIKLAQETDMPIIMDRSPLSCIVFQKMIEINNPELPSVYAYSIEAFYDAYEKGEIFFPQVMVYIQPPGFEDFKQRVANRGETPIEMFNTYQCGKIMELWYKLCVKKCFKDFNSLVLPSGNNQIQSNIDFASSFLISEANYKTNPFINLPTMLDDK